MRDKPTHDRQIKGELTQFGAQAQAASSQEAKGAQAQAASSQEAKGVQAPAVLQHETQTARRPREPQYELLRVIAMLMVVTLHYLNWGGLLRSEDYRTLALSWTLEALCIVSVNVYVLISGYFLVDAQFRFLKLLRLWFQVLTYSVLIYLIDLVRQVLQIYAAPGGAFTLASLREQIQGLDLYTIQYYFLPITNRHYWFATSYLLLYLLSPLLGKGVRLLDRKQHGMLTLLLLLFTSLPQSFVPVPLELNDAGQGVLWFIVLYLIAAYLRLYGLPMLDGRPWRAFLLYLLMVPCILASVFFFWWWGTTRGGDVNGWRGCEYNDVFVLAASVALFCSFRSMRLRESALLRGVTRIAPYTFGVYLLHEHLLVRGQWTAWFHTEAGYGLLRVPHWIGTILVVFTAGILVDLLRERLTQWGVAIYLSKREIWDYLIAGVLTTIVAWVTYPIFARVVFAGLPETWRLLIGNAVSWMVTVVFAYAINRSFVFHSQKRGLRAVGGEFLSFVAARLFSFGVEEVLLVLLVRWLHVSEFLSKYVLISVIVIVLNYILSKLWIFKKSEPDTVSDREA